MQTIKAIISDADGTLVNTLYLIRHGQYETAVEYLVERGIPRHDIPEYEVYESYINKSVGGSTRETLEKTLRMLFGRTHEQHLDHIDFDELNERLQPIQDRIAPLYVHPFHGLTELFTWAGQSGTGFGIFTSGSPHHIVRNFGVSLPVLGYTDLFRNKNGNDYERLSAFIQRAKAIYGFQAFSIVTCDDVAKTKPDPEGILKLLDNLGVTADEAIVIGDHAVDMQAARNAGVHSIGLSHGFGTAAELKEAGALRVVANLSALPAIVEAHNTGREKLF